MVKNNLNKNSKNENRKIGILIIIMIILIIITLATILTMIVRIFEKKEEPKVQYVTGVEKDQKLVERLKGKSEFKRMNIYLGDIVRKLNSKRYTEVYKRLAPEYKEKYFKNIEEFEKYFKEYFPTTFSIKNVNFEALGEYYVVEVDVIADDSKEENKNKQGLYFVFREYDFDDYVFSFSKNN